METLNLFVAKRHRERMSSYGVRNGAISYLVCHADSVSESLTQDTSRPSRAPGGVGIIVGIETRSLLKLRPDQNGTNRKMAPNWNARFSSYQAPCAAVSRQSSSQCGVWAPSCVRQACRLAEQRCPGGRFSPAARAPAVTVLLPSPARETYGSGGSTMMLGSAPAPTPAATLHG